MKSARPAHHVTGLQFHFPAFQRDEIQLQQRNCRLHKYQEDRAVLADHDGLEYLVDLDVPVYHVGLGVQLLQEVQAVQLGPKGISDRIKHMFKCFSSSFRSHLHTNTLIGNYQITIQTP